MLIYSWQLTIAVVLLVIPLLLVVGSHAGAALGRVRRGADPGGRDARARSPSRVMGAAVVRAYGLDDTIRRAG